MAAALTELEKKDQQETTEVAGSTDVAKKTPDSTLSVPQAVQKTAATADMRKEFLKPNKYREWKEKLGLTAPKYKLITFDIASNMKDTGVTFLNVSKEIGDVEKSGYKYFYLIGVAINGTWLIPEKANATAVFCLFDTRMTNVSAAKVAAVTAKAKNGDFRMITRPNYPVSVRDFKKTSWALAHWIESNDVRNDVDVTACEIGFFYSLSKTAIMNSLRDGLTDVGFDDNGRISGTISEDKVEELCNKMEVQNQLYQLGIINRKNIRKQNAEKFKNKNGVVGHGDGESDAGTKLQQHFEKLHGLRSDN